MTRLAPKVRGFLGQPCFHAMACYQFGLVLKAFKESSFQNFNDAGMQRASWVAQQRAIGSVLQQCVLKQVSSVGRHALPEQQTSRKDKPYCSVHQTLAYAPHRIAVGGICLPAFMRHVHEAPSVLTKKNVPSFVELGGTSAGSACAGQSSSGSPWSA